MTPAVTVPALLLCAARGRLPGAVLEADGEDVAVSGTTDVAGADAAMLGLGFVRATPFAVPGRPVLYRWDPRSARILGSGTVGSGA